MSRFGLWVALVWAVFAAAGCSLFVSSHHRVEDYTPMFAAADACDTVKVRQTIEPKPVLLKKTEWEGATLLHEAVAHDCEDLSRYLLEKGADPNAAKGDGVTPLHLAAQRGNMGIVELLLSHGAEINPVDSKGWTPLDRAELWQHPSAAAYLGQHGGSRQRP